MEFKGLEYRYHKRAESYNGFKAEWMEGKEGEWIYLALRVCGWDDFNFFACEIKGERRGEEMRGEVC